MSPAGGRRSPHFPPLQALLIALGCGLLIGAERERRNAIRAPRSAAGLRTFTIAGPGGGISMIAGGPMLLGVLVLGLASGFASSSATIGSMGGWVRAALNCLNACVAAALTALGRSGIFAARGYREPAAEAPRFGQSLRIVMALVFAVLPLLLAWSSSTLAKLVLALGAGSRGFALRVAPGLGLILGATWLAAWLRGVGLG